MRKFIWLFLVLITTTFVIMAQDTLPAVGDSTQFVITHVTTQTPLEFLKANMFTLIFAVFLVIDSWLGQTGIVKDGTFWSLVINTIGKILGKKANIIKTKYEKVQAREFKKMKAGAKAILMICLLSLGSMTFAQNSGAWNGFFDPVSQAVNNSYQLKSDGDVVSGVFKFRTSFSFTAFAVELSQDQPEVSSLSAAGLGLSWGKYLTTAEGKAYCKYSINAAFLTKMEFGESTDAKIGLSVTGDIYNKILGIGPGVYFDAGKPKWLLLFNVAVPL